MDDSSACTGEPGGACQEEEDTGILASTGCVVRFPEGLCQLKRCGDYGTEPVRQVHGCYLLEVSSGSLRGSESMGLSQFLAGYPSAS